MFDLTDDEPLERDDLHTRTARRLEELEHERQNFRVTALFGALLVAVAGGVGGFVAGSLRRGFVELDEVSSAGAAGEPALFYGSLAVIAALGLACGVMGVRMLMHALRERRRTSRVEERLRRVGARRR